MRACTLRELAILIKAALWRQRWEIRLTMTAAWNGAAWTAARLAGARIPPLSEILQDLDPTTPPPPKSPEEVWAAIVDWASQQRGCRFEVHDKPVLTES